jgi:hypothetical protein
VAKELTEHDLRTRRLKTCVERFPGAETGEYNQACCRFPKNCSPYARIEAYQAGNISENDLEPIENAPVRFERAESPEGHMPIPRRDNPVVTEKKTLQPLRVGNSFFVDTEIDDSHVLALEMGRRRVQMEAYVLQEHLADDYYDGQSDEYAFPKTWWDHFKETYGDRWWLRWWYKRHGAQYDHKSFPVRVKVERYANYPEADITIPRLGRPVPYETTRRLTHFEVEDMELQRQLERLRKESDEEGYIVAYLAIPENFEELMAMTGLPKEHFEELYRFDRTFDLNTQVYLIPEGVGYRQAKA